MQILADVLGMTVEVRAGEQPVALGAAMFAATAAGLHPRVEDAQRAMSSGTEARYQPDPGRARPLRRLYRDYRKLGSFVEKELTKELDSVGRSRWWIWKSFEVWFLTGSQDLYGEAALKQVAEHSREIAAHLDGSGAPTRAGSSGSRRSRAPEAILDLCREANACRQVRRRHHVDAHLLAGEDVDRRARARLQKPLAHLHTQFNARAAVGDRSTWTS